MTDPLIIGSSQGNLGDNLLITPIFKAVKNARVRLFEDQSCRNVAPLFDGLVDSVEFCAAPGTPPTVNLPLHKSQRMLIALGLEDQVTCVPQIIVRPDELEWARDYLWQYGNPASMVVVVNQNSGWRSPENWFARYLKVPHEIMVAMVAQCHTKGFTPIQFGLSVPADPARDNFDPLEGCIHVRGLSVRETAACYQLISRMVTGDTGDPCLMLAVGGQITMLVAPESQFYRHYDIQYTPDLWKGERIRARYHEYKDCDRTAADLEFDW